MRGYPLACLQAMRLFFEMVEGQMVKEISSSGSIEIGVVHEHLTKTVVLPRNCTLWRLRKQVMKEFSLSGDFWLYSLHMKRDITFAEEEEYSLNALPQLVTLGQSVHKPPVGRQLLDRPPEVVTHPSHIQSKQ